MISSECCNFKRAYSAKRKPKKNDLIKLSEQDKVDAYIKKCKHPLEKVVEALRQIILDTDKEIGEKPG